MEKRQLFLKETEEAYQAYKKSSAKSPANSGPTPEELHKRLKNAVQDFESDFDKETNELQNSFKN